MQPTLNLGDPHYIPPKGIHESWDYWLTGHEKIVLPAINHNSDFIAEIRRPTPHEKLSASEISKRSTVTGKLNEVDCGKSSAGGIVIRRNNSSKKSILCNSYLRRSVQECKKPQYPHWNMPSDLVGVITKPWHARDFLAQKNMYGLVVLADHTNSNGLKLINPPRFRFVFFYYGDIDVRYIKAHRRNGTTIDRWKIHYDGLPAPVTKEQFFKKLNQIL